MVLIERGQVNHVDADTTNIEGVQVRLVYDDHDVLRAAAGAHFLND